MFSTLISDPLSFILTLISLVIAVTIHECAHAFVADKLGDPTPRVQGRISLNPLKHLDPIGTLMILFVRFGWGKPVEYDAFNLKNPKRDVSLIALAGPASNLLLAIILAILIHVATLPSFFSSFVVQLIVLNVSLAVFNIIPVHPLDGGKILMGVLPDDLARDWDAILRKYGMLILLLLIFPFGNSQSPISYLITPIIRGILTVLFW